MIDLLATILVTGALQGPPRIIANGCPIPPPTKASFPAHPPSPLGCACPVITFRDLTNPARPRAWSIAYCSRMKPFRGLP